MASTNDLQWRDRGPADLATRPQLGQAARGQEEQPATCTTSSLAATCWGTRFLRPCRRSRATPAVSQGQTTVGARIPHSFARPTPRQSPSNQGFFQVNATPLAEIRFTNEASVLAAAPRLLQGATIGSATGCVTAVAVPVAYTRRRRCVCGRYALVGIAAPKPEGLCKVATYPTPGALQSQPMATSHGSKTSTSNPSLQKCRCKEFGRRCGYRKRRPRSSQCRR